MKSKDQTYQRELSISVIFPQDGGELWNDNLEIVFVLKGEGYLKLGNNDKDYLVAARDIFVVNRYQMRTLNLKPGGIALSIQITPSLFASLCTEQFGEIFECKSFLFSEKNQNMFDIIRRDVALVFKAYYKNNNYPVVVRSQVGMLLADLIRYFSDGSMEGQDNKRTGMQHLRLLTGYIHGHYQENITLQMLSIQSFLSVSYISHLFKNHLGQTFTGYLKDVRLSHAMELLSSEATITEIAMKTGFADTTSFIDAFRQKYDVTPGRYRKLYEKREADNERKSLDFSELYEMINQYIKLEQGQPEELRKSPKLYEFDVNVLQQKNY